MVKAKFSIQFPKPADGVVAIRDDGIEEMSITNDAEAVVQNLYETNQLTAADTLIYRDSEGRWDQIVHVGGEFAGFRPLGAATVEAAIEILRKKKK